MARYFVALVVILLREDIIPAFKVKDKQHDLFSSASELERLFLREREAAVKLKEMLAKRVDVIRNATKEEEAEDKEAILGLLDAFPDHTDLQVLYWK